MKTKFGFVVAVKTWSSLICFKKNIYINYTVRPSNAEVKWSVVVVLILCVMQSENNKTKKKKKKWKKMKKEEAILTTCQSTIPTWANLSYQ